MKSSIFPVFRAFLRFHLLIFQHLYKIPDGVSAHLNALVDTVIAASNYRVNIVSIFHKINGPIKVYNGAPIVWLASCLEHAEVYASTQQAGKKHRIWRFAAALCAPNIIFCAVFLESGGAQFITIESRRVWKT
ncbi:hypothetical protein C6W92_04010 [Roseovarius sp. A46]|nr:hypothetical protein C6W92_04010 [Roseovarius sp. A46]